MVVIGHPAVGVTAPIEVRTDFPEHRQPGGTAFVVAKDRLAAIAAQGAMMESARKLDSERPATSTAETGKTGLRTPARGGELI
jgi:hypothetical protein